MDNVWMNQRRHLKGEDIIISTRLPKVKAGKNRSNRLTQASSVICSTKKSLTQPPHQPPIENGCSNPNPKPPKGRDGRTAEKTPRLTHLLRGRHPKHPNPN